MRIRYIFITLLLAAFFSQSCISSRNSRERDVRKRYNHKPCNCGEHLNKDHIMYSEVWA